MIGHPLGQSCISLAREGRTLDKQSTNTESAPVWRILRFFGLENRRDKESLTANNREGRKGRIQQPGLRPLRTFDYITSNIRSRSFPMPKAYAVVTYRSVSDPEKLAAYARLAAPAVAPFGARFLARGDAAVAREHGVKGRRISELREGDRRLRQFGIRRSLERTW